MEPGTESGAYLTQKVIPFTGVTGGCLSGETACVLVLR